MAIDVLLSGFEPFDGAEVNESWEAVRRAAPALRERGIDAQELLLPVEFGRAAELLLDQVRRRRPRRVVAVGLAAGRAAITPERVAINVQDARIPDNAGSRPIDEPCVPGAPAGLFSTLPIKAMVAAAQGDGATPAQVSQSAGTFVCNDVFYRLQHALATVPELAGVRGGFVHVPAADALSPAATAHALRRMAEAALETEEDLRRPGGAEH